MDLDKLEELAKAALWTGDWNASCGTVDCAYPPDSKFAGEFDEIAHPVPVGVSDYIEAAQPKAILALIAEVRALREDAERWRWIRQGKPVWVKVPVKGKQVEYFMGHKPEHEFPECFDKAVDAARGAK